MAKKYKWEAHGQTVSSADVRRWMQSVGAHISRDRWPQYIKVYNVVDKIARHKAAGTFDSTIASACSSLGTQYTVRKARSPGTLARLRASWPMASNQLKYHKNNNTATIYVIH